MSAQKPPMGNQTAQSGVQNTQKPPMGVQTAQNGAQDTPQPKLDVNTIPKISNWLRCTNLIITIVVIYLVWSLNLISTGIGIISFSGTKMPIIYVFTLLTGLTSLLLTLSGNGLHMYSLCWIPAIVSIVVGLILINTQIYLYAISISVLGFATVIDLLNGFHFWMIIIIICLFISSYLSFLIAAQIKRRNEWLDNNRLIWPNEKPVEGNRQLSPLSKGPVVKTKSPKTKAPQNPMSGPKPYPTQQPVPMQQTV